MEGESVLSVWTGCSSVAPVKVLVQLEDNAVALIVREERYTPEEWVVAEDGDQVAAKAAIVRLSCMERVVLLAPLLTKLDRCELAIDQVEMEEHEEGDDDGQDAREDVRRHHKVADFVIEGVGVCECAANNRITRRNDNQACHTAMEEHVHEEFVVVETDAVSDPWAVMVHLENASIAL